MRPVLQSYKKVLMCNDEVLKMTQLECVIKCPMNESQTETKLKNKRADLKLKQVHLIKLHHQRRTGVI